MNRKLIVLTIVLGIFASSIPGILAATDTIQVNVSVESVAQVVIIQESLNWTNVNPGGTGGMLGIDVKNTGSTNVTNIYAYVDTLATETTNPIGSDNPLSYSAAGVITLRRNETSEENYFAGRLEWNYTDSIELATLPAGTTSWGWFRNSTKEYVWALVNGTEVNATHGCNATGTALRVNKYPDAGNTTTRDVNSGTNSVAGDLDDTVEDWGIFSFSDGPWNSYCVAAASNCEKIYLYKYDRRNSGSTDFSGCTNLGFLNTTESLAPNSIQKVNLDTWLPYGMPAGDLEQGILTIYAEE